MVSSPPRSAGCQGIWQSAIVRNTFLEMPEDDFGVAAARRTRCSSVPASLRLRNGADESSLVTPQQLKAHVRSDSPACGSPEHAKNTCDDALSCRKRTRARPTKQQRESYRQCVMDWEAALVNDPLRFDIHSVVVPATLSPEPETLEFLQDKLRRRLQQLHVVLMTGHVVLE